jgi:hypothetical protein
MDTRDTKTPSEGTRRPPLGFVAILLCVLAVFGGDRTVAGQIAMPDPKQMSGIPRPVTDLPGGSVSVRLIKGELSNNLTGHPVELYVNGKPQTVNTDDAGRAQFDKLTPGATLKAVAVVDGERLESQEFPAPAEGGIRVMLVATDKEKEAQKAADASAPAVAGTVVLGQNSQIVFEVEDDTLSVFYSLEILNNTRTPVNPTTPFVFQAPAGTRRTTLLRGSSQRASVDGNQVTVAGPFPPGATQVEIVMTMPVGSGTIAMTQTFPALLESLFVVAKKDGDMKLTSPQIQRQQDTMSSNTPVIVGAGSAIAAGQPISVTLSGLAHHSPTPRRVALGLVGFMIVAGVWAATRKDDEAASGDERKRLLGRREKLFQELIRLEHDQRRGKGSVARRDELLSSLEQVYGALDSTDAELRTS